MPRKRVVIVDDSNVMRSLIARCLVLDGRFDIVGEAADPFEAREVIKRTNPDVLTLDVEMPRMDGLTFLEKIMRLRPMPIVMFSTETHRGSVAAVEALSLGAVDCIGKPRAGVEGAMQTLADRVFIAAGASVHARKAPPTPVGRSFDWNGKMVLIGASTGGVDALERVLYTIPKNGPPILIAQHMPASFLASFSDRLAQTLSGRVQLASDGEPVRQGQIRLAPGGEEHLIVQRGTASGRCALLKAPKRNGHCPSVDVLFESAVPMAKRVVSVILTGMGRDGAEGMVRLRSAGAHTIGQDQNTSVVFGMPRVAAELGGVVQTVSLDRMSDAILAATDKNGFRPS